MGILLWPLQKLDVWEVESECNIDKVIGDYIALFTGERSSTEILGP